MWSTQPLVDRLHFLHGVTKDRCFFLTGHTILVVLIGLHLSLGSQNSTPLSLALPTNALGLIFWWRFGGWLHNEEQSLLNPNAPIE